tara:strand:- start:2376 stop:3113 length:738 start_codon:yes stop_codon:yes gene_type:complete
MLHQVKIEKIKSNPNNPRIIKGNKFKKLVKSIKEFPEMLKLRPIVVNKEMIVLGGNMRLKACIDAGLKEVWIAKAWELTPEQEQEFIVKDNSSFGEWDWDVLANEWSVNKLEEWGLDGFPFDLKEQDNENIYTQKIEVPKYKISENKPPYKEIYNEDKVQELIKEIELSSANRYEKNFLIKAAYRHTVFNYKKIADFYAHSNKEVQNLMEKSALIIIDFEKAIENGYIALNQEITNQYIEDYGDE